MQLSLTVNGQAYHFESDPRALLLHVLREELRLRGTKYGCGEGECGACTVLCNGQPVNACLMTVGQADQADILTIEGMAADEIGAAVLAAFSQCGAVQCGFCTPGFVISARALLAESTASTTETIQRGLSGNFCRCTGYTKIIQAVSQAGQALKTGRLAVSKDSRAVERDGGPADDDDGQGQFARPARLAEALELLAQPKAEWRVVAGGTDILVKNEHRLKGLSLLDLGRVAELGTIREEGDRLRIGALVSYTDLARSPLVQTWAAALAMAAREVGGVQIQNMGTLAGNLVNASPAADGVPPLFVLDARLVLQSAGAKREVGVAEFATGPGQTILQPDELLTEIIIPKQQHPGEEITFFNKVGPRKAQTIAKASVAFRGWLDDGRLTNVRLAMGAVAPTVIRARQGEEVLMSARLTEELLLQAGAVVHDEARPIDDIRSTATYRRKLVRGLLIRNLHEITFSQKLDTSEVLQ